MKNIKSLLNQLQHFFVREPDLDEVKAYQYKLPRSVLVEIKKDGDYFIACVKKINETTLANDTVVTEAKTVPQLVAEVNDILLTYLDFPENIKPKMPQLLPPEMALHKLPVQKRLVFTK